MFWNLHLRNGLTTFMTMSILLFYHCSLPVPIKHFFKIFYKILTKYFHWLHFFGYISFTSSTDLSPPYVPSRCYKQLLVFVANGSSEMNLSSIEILSKIGTLILNIT